MTDSYSPPWDDVDTVHVPVVYADGREVEGGPEPVPLVSREDVP